MRFQYIYSKLVNIIWHGISKIQKLTSSPFFNYLDVRIRGAAHVQGGQLAALDGRDVEGLRVEVILKLNNKNDNCK